jgi:alpha-beta hydrolase superfamily lysophospholipase
MNFFKKALFVLLAPIIFSGCGHFFYFPDHNFYYPPDKNGYAPKEILFDSTDGTKLHGWYFSSTTKEPPKGLIVQFHGNSENISSHYASLVWITKRGYDLFTFDYRGYGKSENKKPDQKAVYEDGLSALKKAVEFADSKKPQKIPFIVVYGQSLGGIISARSVADFDQQNRVNLLVQDSTFCSFKDMVQEKMASIWLTWIFSPIGRLTVSDKYASEEYFSKIKTPILIVHDREDPVVHFQNAEKIFKLAHEPKVFWDFKKKRHVGIFAIDTPEYRERFLNYLNDLGNKK